jgi:hypothetical protein
MPLWFFLLLGILFCVLIHINSQYFFCLLSFYICAGMDVDNPCKHETQKWTRSDAILLCTAARRDKKPFLDASERVEMLFLLQLRLNASLKKFLQCVWIQRWIGNAYLYSENKWLIQIDYSCSYLFDADITYIHIWIPSFSDS